MLHIYVAKTELSGNLPDGTVYLSMPESYTHTYKGTELTIPLGDLTSEGWKALIVKGKRWVSDGSKTLAQAENKVLRLKGEGKAPRYKDKKSILLSKMQTQVYKRLRKDGLSPKQIGKLGETVEEVCASARKHGKSNAWVKKALAHCERLAAMEEEEI